jgi:hypothetical protein
MSRARWRHVPVFEALHSTRWLWKVGPTRFPGKVNGPRGRHVVGGQVGAVEGETAQGVVDKPQWIGRGHGGGTEGK